MFPPRLSPFLRANTLRSLQQTKMASGFFSSHFPGRPSLGSISSRLPTRPISRRPYSSGPYEPAYESSKRYLLYGFLAVNTGVFAYAMYVQEQARQGNVKPLIDYSKNFTLNYNGVVDDGRWWTMLTYSISHMGLAHFAGNMLSFYFLGEFIVSTPGIGPGKFVTLILGSALAGSVLGLVQRRETIKATGGRDMKRGLGFSGSVMGVSAVAACLYPRSKVALYGIVPIPLWGLVAGYFLYDGWFYNDKNASTGHAGHIGGLAFGLVYYLAALRGVTLPRRF
ncbi:hypothetical protein K491DRAFT_687384 [Lophiostoma macrostomum CBS 122681]|uniref:Peptidase S54 rhomboid domain-containing protein n=1 Tax=Lophiostoma macrostomum CBS 122681 TaxID=1314788 RepID=A0A6A6TPA9_9PLEO|nr:hypothetical protein K491DRAFT_687384 [Lophiostoma macrostomum CBS 122681]